MWKLYTKINRKYTIYFWNVHNILRVGNTQFYFEKCTISPPSGVPK